MKKFFVLIPFALLAACGGGGGGGGSLPSTVPSPPSVVGVGVGGATPTPVPSTTPTAGPTPTAVPTQTPTPIPTSMASPAPASVSFTASIPLNESQNYLRNPLVFGVRLLSVNGAPANAVTTQSTSCASTACRVKITAPVGNDTFSITYAISSNGALAPLAYHGSFGVTVAANANTTAAVSLQGVPAYYELDAVGNAPWTNLMPLFLQNADDSNVCTPPQVINGCTITNFINGTLAAPVTLTDTDTSGQTALSLNHGTPANAVTVTHASDSVALVIHAGANLQQAYVTPSATFNASEFGSPYTSIVQKPWATQDPNGLGFTCSNGTCQTTGPSSITIQ